VWVWAWALVVVQAEELVQAQELAVAQDLVVVLVVGTYGNWTLERATLNGNNFAASPFSPKAVSRSHHVLQVYTGASSGISYPPGEKYDEGVPVGVGVGIGVGVPLLVTAILLIVCLCRRPTAKVVQPNGRKDGGATASTTTSNSRASTKSSVTEESSYASVA
jgi:hypothetical protein